VHGCVLDRAVERSDAAHDRAGTVRVSGCVRGDAGDCPAEHAELHRGDLRRRFPQVSEDRRADVLVDAVEEHRAHGGERRAFGTARAEQVGVGLRPNHVDERTERAERRQRPLRVGIPSGEDDRRHHDRPPVVLDRQERQWRRPTQHGGDRRDLVRRLGGRRDERRDRLRSRGQHEQPAGDRGERVQPEAEARRDAEVAPAAAHRPEQVGLLLGVDVAQLSVRSDDLGRDEAVDRQPVLADEKADAAAERQAADPDGSRVSERDREAVRPERARHLARRQARLDPGQAGIGVEPERLHRRQVEHDPAIRDAVAGEAVRAAPDGELDSRLAGERDDRRDLVGVRRPDDRGGPAVDGAAVHGARLVVARVLRADHLSTELRAKSRK